jgi:hypothetical protein
MAPIAAADLYGLEDAPAAERGDRAQELDDRFLLPERVGVGPRKARRGKQSSGGSLKAMAPWLVAVGVLAVVLIAGVVLVNHGPSMKDLTGISSKAEVEGILQQRVKLLNNLADLLGKVDSAEGAKKTSFQAKIAIEQVTINLRKLRLTQTLKIHMDELKQNYLSQQEAASSRVVQEVFRIATIEDALVALDVEGEFKLLEAEERLAGLSQPNNLPPGLQGIPGAPQAPRPPQFPAAVNMPPQPGRMPGALPGAPPTPGGPPGFGTPPSIPAPPGPGRRPRSGPRLGRPNFPAPPGQGGGPPG